jgi:hypothetical protein
MKIDSQGHLVSSIGAPEDSGLRNFELIEGRHPKNRLTVTPTRISVKLRKDADAVEKEAILSRAFEIAGELANVTQSWRGTFEKNLAGNWKIRLQNNNRSASQRF